jgi:hypothetical protein
MSDDEYLTEMVAAAEQVEWEEERIVAASSEPSESSARMFGSADAAEGAADEVRDEPRLDSLREKTTSFLQSKRNKNTQKKMNMSVRRFRDYVIKTGDKRDIIDIPVEVLDQLLSCFLIELKKPDGSQYEPSTVQSFSSSIRAYLSETIKSVDAEKDFPTSKSVLAAKKKDLKQQGYGNRPNKSKELTKEDEELLWENGALGDGNAEVLQNTMWYLCTKLLGHRGVDEGSKKKWDDLELKSENGLEFVQFRERTTKTRTGENDCSRDFPPKMFANKENEYRCPVRLYKLFASKRPVNGKCNYFYLAINRNKRAQTWYCDGPLGVNKISKIMSKIAEMGGLSGRYTNHSVRRTMCTQLFQSGISPILIAQLSGHRNVNSLAQYTTASIQQQQMMCKTLQSSKPVHSLNVQPQHVITNPMPSTSNHGITHSNDEISTHLDVTESRPQLSSANASNMSNRTVSTQLVRGMFAGATFNAPVNISIAMQPELPD